jgi:hypothetical protein
MIVHKDMDGRSEHTLTILLGAGAPYDCAGGETASAVNAHYRPPLTKDLFAPAFETILGHYEMVRARSNELRTKLAKGKSFEDVFRTLLDSAHRHKTFWAFHVPLYLRELLWTVSDDYLQGSSKYDTLVRCVLESKFTKVLFLNLNYDLFLERALTNYDGHDFKDLDSYCPGSKPWSYVKPHGSVDWASILENCPTNGHGIHRPSLLREPPVLSNHLFRVFWNRRHGGFYSPAPGGEPSGFPYPRIVVPTDNPKEFVCPGYQVEEAKHFIGKCDHFLLIGFSAHDEHIVELLQGIPEKSHVIIVSKDDATDILERMRSRIPTLNSEGQVIELHNEGFGFYIEGSAFERLVAD